MNNKLLFGSLIVLLFVIILFVPQLLKQRENFQATMFKYPSELMIAHNDFINSKSNQYSNIYNLFEILSNDVYTTVSEEIDSSNSISINETYLITNILNKVFGKYKLLSKSPNCSATNKNEECKLYLIVLQYIMNEYSTSISLPTDLNVSTYPLLEMNLVTNDSDIENNLKFPKINDAISKLNTQLLTNNINNYTTSRKELVVKKYVKNVLFNIYFTIYPSSVGSLACPLYTADSCPSTPFSSDSGNDSSVPTLPSALENKFKCKIDNSFKNNMSSLCVNNSNNKYITPNCEVMNGYGETMCENTLFFGESGSKPTSCKFENMTQRCVNSDVADVDYLNTNKNDSGNYEEKANLTGSKCHLLYHSDLGEMEKICGSQSKCEYRELNDINNEKYGLCMAKEVTERPANFCLELSNIDEKFAELKGCHIIKKQGFFYSTANPDTLDLHKEENLPCYLFDSLNEKYNKDSNDASDKTEDDKAYVKGNENQKKLCEGLMSDLGERRCKYVEYHKYIPNDHKSKYAKLGMCLPKNSVNLDSELINNKEECNKNFYWSDKNNMCVDVNAKCHKHKHKNICNLYDNCLWNASEVSSTSDENYEHGYCRDLSSSLKRVEDLIDNIHQSHLQNAVDLNTIEDNISKIIPKFKNIITSN